VACPPHNIFQHYLKNVTIFEKEITEHEMRVLVSSTTFVGARGGAVVEALRYKPEGRGIDSRWCHWILSLT
jgi:hypothetical protein